jgi:signal transduction histidine kinase
MTNLSLPAMHAPTLFLVVGLMYLLMPLTLWTVLHGRHDARSTALWCVGAMLSAATLLLASLRGGDASAFAMDAANALGYLGVGMRWAALRRERGRVPPPLTIVVLVLLASLGYVAFTAVGDRARLGFSLPANALGAAFIAYEALRLAEEQASRSARMLGSAYAVLAAALLLRLVTISAGVIGPAAPSFTLETVTVLLGSLLAALWGNIGYLGFAMEMAQRHESARTAELAAATARSEVAERQAAVLKALSDERQELLRVITHEVRQPLHNAQAVLQGVDSALQTHAGADRVAEAWVARTHTVLRNITASLDNTLAASTLLVGERPSTPRDADLDILLDLTLGDLPPAGRARVCIVRDSEVRTAAMDTGLMRLALRNLLVNALAYATPGTPVTLRVSDSDEPLALLISVADEGPGMAAELLGRAFERGTRGRPDVPGQGLGLYIVRRAMEQQGGSVDVTSDAGGSVFTLTLPQGVEPE